MRTDTERAAHLPRNGHTSEMRATNKLERARVTEWLCEQYEPATLRQIEQATGIPRKTLRNRMESLRLASRVVCVGRDRRGKLWVAT